MDMYMRRKCQKCRLQKCKEVGMLAECMYIAIMRPIQHTQKVIVSQLRCVCGLHWVCCMFLYTPRDMHKATQTQVVNWKLYLRTFQLLLLLLTNFKCALKFIATLWHVG